MEHLIANSGIHFVTKEIEFNPSEPFQLSNGKILKYSFSETTDFLSGEKVFSILYDNQQQKVFIPVDEQLQKADGAILRKTNGREQLDEAGMLMMTPNYPTTMLASYPYNDPDVYNINSLQSFRVTNPDPRDGVHQVPAFDLLLDKWLPMPMFRKEVDGVTNDYPFGWCRMKISKLGEGAQKGYERYRLIWGFDTQLTEDPLSMLRPYMDEDEGETAEFCMCNKVDLLMNFLSSSEEFHAFSDYIASLLGIDLNQNNSRKYKAFYIYFLNFIRLSGGAPTVILHNNAKKDIFVDLVLDIGNSRTCGVLFEESDFTRGKLLSLRNLSSPWECYENKTFDMRVVFRKADFGNDIILDEEMFQWKSFVRVGEEARKLIYRSLEEEGLSEKTTNYSSPKRYLWDTKKYEGRWENLVTIEDPFNVRLSNIISVPTLSNLFDDDGKFLLNGVKDSTDLLNFEDNDHHYSRASLMTFAFVEIFQQAISQINSIEYRERWGNVDCKRYIRKVIITCPTAMPHNEQVYLRQSAQNAYQAVMKCIPNLKMADIIPNASAVSIIDQYADIESRVWSYDEASCCQLVYLYAELTNRYKGEVHKFFELKGHVRPELAEQGYNKKSLTIGTVDIGAGTTDLMICSYQYEGDGHSKITPIPLFWDSFYLAGDDILRNIVQSIVIEGKEHHQTGLGSISSALTTRIIEMSDDMLKSLPCFENIVYRSKIHDICATVDQDEKRHKKVEFASVLIHDFFGTDSSMMSYRDRRCRTDFNTQISVPIAQYMMELLRKHRPSKMYTYGELFPEIKPADYLLNHFEHHFGFRFEELQWRYDPKEIADIVKSTMEPLMKQLAVVFYAHHCDIVILAGRPTSLDAITELFIKYVPTSPDRLIRLNEYRVGPWFPTADGQGYFFDQKAVVATGGMVGYLASHAQLKGLLMDFSQMIKKMTSTANYIGEYNSHRQQVAQSVLSPIAASATLTLSVFPAFLGCKQLDSAIYQARPLYAIYNHSTSDTFKVRLSRSYHEDKELLTIEEVTDSQYRNRIDDLELVQQSLVDDGKYWLDKGEFELTIK